MKNPERSAKQQDQLLEDTLAAIHTAAEKLHGEHTNTRELIVAIKKFISSHADSLPRRRRAKTIIESRFTPAPEAFATGMLSCGAFANITAEMLRHLGFRVKLVHGETHNSVDHAWISVYEPTLDKWMEYDPALHIDVPSTHIKKEEVDAWEEIQDQIHSDAQTLRARRKERGISPEGLLPKLRFEERVGSLPTSVFGLFVNGVRVGFVQIRHKLSHGEGVPAECASHIFYNIEPAHQNNGYGTEILRLGLAEARNIGLQEVVVACDSKNIASKKIIEANGGVFAGACARADGGEHLRYRFNLQA